MQISNQIHQNRFEIVEEQPPPNRWRDFKVVATVGPNGEVAHTFFDKALLRRGEPVQMGMTPVMWSAEAQAFLVPAYFAKRGWVLYEDLCNGNVKGCDASPEHWRLWVGLCSMRAKGREPGRGALEQAAKKLGLSSIYHPEVIRRRKGAASGGMFSLDAAAVMDFLGLQQQEHDLDLDEYEGED